MKHLDFLHNNTRTYINRRVAPAQELFLNLLQDTMSGMDLSVPAQLRLYNKMEEIIHNNSKWAEEFKKIMLEEVNAAPSVEQSSKPSLD